MTVSVDPLLVQIATALGVVDAQGAFDPAWLETPIDNGREILSDPNRRAALLSALDTLLPPGRPADAPESEHWHPLLSQGDANLYLTAANGGTGATTFGLAAVFASSDATDAPVVTASLPLLAADTELKVLEPDGTSGALHLGISMPLASQSPVTAITLEADIALVAGPNASIAPPSLRITLDGIWEAGQAQDVTIDSSNPEVGAIAAVNALVGATLGAGTASGLTHLASLLGLDGGQIPAIPVADLADDPTALRTWLATVLTGSAGDAWLSDLAGLFGASAARGTDGSWSIALGTLEGVTLTLLVTVTNSAAGTPSDVTLGVSVATGALAGGPTLGADVELVDMPLQSGAAATSLPSAHAYLSYTPGTHSTVTVGTLRAGVQVSGGAVRPLLELDNVQIQGQSTLATVDLTDADTLLNAAGADVLTPLVAGFGSDPPGSYLLVLSGLVAPPTDAQAPTVTAASLLEGPIAAIAEVHRQALARTGWASMMPELCGLLGLPAPSGAGTAQSPLLSQITTSGPLTLSFAAWSPAADRLSLGLEAQVNGTPGQATLRTTLLALGLTAGSLSAQLLDDHSVTVDLTGPLTSPADARVQVGAASMSLTADIPRPGPATVTATVTSVTVAVDGETVSIPTLSFPPPAGADLGNPQATLGVDAATLAALTSHLFTAALASWGGDVGASCARAIGLDLTGDDLLSTDFPTLEANLAAWCRDPLAAIGTWLATVLSGTSSDGRAFATEWMARAADFVSTLVTPSADDYTPTVTGAGTYERPWCIELVDGGAPVDALLWVEPDGPPFGWAQALAALFTTGAAPDCEDIAELLTQIAAASNDLDDELSDVSADDLAAGLDTLSDHLVASDGVVPTSEQAPNDSSWQTAAVLSAAHANLPGDPDARAAVKQALDAWSGANAQRCVLFLGPSFADASDWTDLAGDLGGASATFSFRDPGFDVRSVGAASNYPVELSTGVDTAALVTEIAAAVDQVTTVSSGLPIYIVAHSTAGVAATEYLAGSGRSAAVKGLVTLAAPLGGAPLTPLTDPPTIDALRVIERVLGPSGLQDDQLNAAVGHLIAALNGLAGFDPSSLAAPVAYPIAAFTAPASTDTGGVPALALQSQLTTMLDADLSTSLGALAATAADPTPAPRAPQALGVGARLHLHSPAATADQGLAIDCTLRTDLARIGLPTTGVAAAAWRPGVEVVAVVRRPAGWLVGGPGYDSTQSPIATRVRWAELGATIRDGANGVHTITPFVRLHDAALLGRTLGVVGLADAGATTLLGDVIDALAADPDGSALVDALQALGFVSNGGLSSAAVEAFAADPASFLAGKLETALTAGLLDLQASADGAGWTVPCAELDATATLYPDPWRIEVTTGADSTLQLTAALSFDELESSLSGSVALGATTVTFSTAGSGPASVSIAAPPWLTSTPLVPAPAASAGLDELVLRVLLSAAAAPLLEAVAGAGGSVGAIDALLSGPAAWLRLPTALGDGTTLSAGKVNALLGSLATGLGLQGAPSKLIAPGDVTLEASDLSTGGVRLTAATSSTLTVDDVGLAFALSADIAGTGDVTPSGSLTLTLEPQGGQWSSIAIALGFEAGGWTLAVTPSGTASPITLLPSVTGLGSLAAATYLLPEVLGRLAGHQPASNPKPVIALTRALGLSFVGSGSAHEAFDSTKLLALVDGDWLATATPTQAQITALKNVLPQGLSVDATGTMLTYTQSLGGSSSATVKAGWGSTRSFEVDVDGVALDSVTLSVSAKLALSGGNVVPTVGVTLTLTDAALGGLPTPAVVASTSSAGLSLSLLPLGPTTTSPTLQIAPSLAVQPSTDALANLALTWLAPLALDVVLSGIDLTGQAWAGGPTWGAFFANAGVTKSATSPALALPLVPATILAKALGAVESSIALPGGISVAPSSEPGVGLAVSGAPSFDIGPYKLTVLLGDADTVPGQTEPGLHVALFDESGSTLSFHRRIRLTSVGVELARGDGSQLVSTGAVTLDSLRGLLFADFDLEAAGTPTFATRLGGAVDLSDLGLPLMQLLTPSSTSGSSAANPVAISLLASNDGSAGNAQPASPTVTLVAYQQPGDAQPTFTLTGEDANGIVWVGVHATFGPLSIDQVGFKLAGGVAELLVDGGIEIAGLVVQVDELSLTAPLDKLGSPESWTFDLAGLAAAFSASVVSLAGGMLKTSLPDGVEYDGVLTVQVAELGLTAVGSYARLGSQSSGYTSVFVVLGISAPLGGPPYLFVTGLGAGFGYNRALVVPTDMDEIEDFPLVEAIGDSSFESDPMTALTSMGTFVPPQRGALWLGAGVEFTSFTLVDTVAVAYVALDNGLEIGVLGLSTMTLPPDLPAGVDPLASVQLALKARFSTSEGVLSIQAQLTDNSWLLTHDCRLTGGFAFFIWFTQDQFVLTLGGYNPNFIPPPQFPTVPRLGLSWHVSDEISIVGGLYFALTSSCVMAGGSLDASISTSDYSAWATVYADMLVAWDPLHYAFDAGISIGVKALGTTMSASASATASGPPLHATVTANLELISVNVSFGAQQATPQPSFLTDAQAFANKYLLGGDGKSSPYQVSVTSGLIAPASGRSSGSPSDGSVNAPWQIGGEASIAATTTLPSTSWSAAVVWPADHEIDVPPAIPAPTDPVTGAAPIATIDLAAMGLSDLESSLTVTLAPASIPGDEPGSINLGVTVTAIMRDVPAATWHYSAAPAASADTLPTVVGLQLAISALDGAVTPDVDVGTLVETHTQGLPLDAAQSASATTLGYGKLADELAGDVATLDTKQLTALSAWALAANRIAGAPQLAQPASPLALRSLAFDRTAPPMPRALTYGMSNRRITLPPGVLIHPIPPQSPVVLRTPTLRTSARAVALPAPGSLGSPRLTASSAAAGLPLGDVPTLSTRWKNTLRMTTALRPVAAAAQASATRAATTRARKTQRTASGTKIPSGGRRVWDLPAGGPAALTLSGSGAARVTAITAAGLPCADAEYQLTDAPLRVQPPSTARRVVVEALGRVLAAENGVVPAAAMGAVAANVAPPGALPVTGWQRESRLFPAGASTLLARGSLVRVAQPLGVVLRTSGASVPATALMASVPALETWLPGSSASVGILLDGAGPGAAIADVPLAVEGFRLGSSSRVQLGNRILLLGEVEREEEAATLKIATAVSFTIDEAPVVVAGVIGFSDAADVVRRDLEGVGNVQLVSDSALSSDGWITVELDTNGSS